MNPSDVNRSLAAHQEHKLEFDFENQHSSKKIYNVTLKDTSYLNWSDTRFHVNASSSRTVDAVFYKPSPGRVNDSIEVPYYYNQTEGNETGITFDKNFYPVLSFQILTFYEETNVSLEVFEQDFELELNESGESVFEVQNLGSETAFNVSFQGEDISFDQSQGADLSPGEDLLVKYSVEIPKPVENATGATNRTYERRVTVTGENFDPVNFTVSVFVPFREYDEIERQRDVIEALQRLQQFCSREENQDLPICGAEVVKYRNVTRVVNNTPVYQANFTDAEKNALVQYANASTEKYQDILHRVQLQQNTIRSENRKTRQAYNESAQDLEEQLEENEEVNKQSVELLNRTLSRWESRQRRRGTRNAILFGFFTIAVVGYAGYRAVQKLMDQMSDRRI